MVSCNFLLTSRQIRNWRQMTPIGASTKSDKGIAYFCLVLGPKCYFIVGEGYITFLVCGIVVKYLNCRSQTPYRWANKTFTKTARDSNPESSDILPSHSAYFLNGILYIESPF